MVHGNRKLHKDINGTKYKHCSKCNEWLSLGMFNKTKRSWDGMGSHCRQCCKIYKATYYLINKKEITIKQKLYCINNKEKVSARWRVWRLKNKEKLRAKSKAWYTENKERSKSLMKEWRLKNKELSRTYSRTFNRKYRATLKGSLCSRMCTAVYHSLKGSKGGRSWEKLVRYTAKDLEKHLKTTMPEGYTWSDYLSGKLHIDHKRPISSFTFINSEQQGFKDCWSLKNLQLLTAFDNLSKGSKKAACDV